MTTDKESRWSSNFSPELPKRKGVVNHVNKFDAAFFGVRFKLYFFVRVNLTFSPKHFKNELKDSHQTSKLNGSSRTANY